MKEIAAIAAHLASAAGPAVLATLVSAAGSSYRRPGARLLVTAAGRRIGSISGGCLEEDVLVHARQVSQTGRATVLRYDTTSENDLVWGVGLGCHGIVEVLVEPLPDRPAWAVTLAGNLARRVPTDLAVTWTADDPASLGTRLAADPAPRGAQQVFRQAVRPAPALYVFGAGDDARPLASLARALGWHVTIADPRAAMTTAARFPDADAIVSGPADTLVAKVQPEAGALAVVMTHHYVHDVPLLRDLLPRPLAYLGLLGPKQRAARILADLSGKGNGAPANPLHAPVGLDLGAEHPEEVALSILAEMQAVLAGRDARPLRERTAPIHQVGSEGERAS